VIEMKICENEAQNYLVHIIEGFQCEGMLGLLPIP